MTIEFGLAPLPGPPADDLKGWLDDLETVLPTLEGHFRSLWLTDHFFSEGQPIYEAWTTMAFLAGRFPAFEVGSMVLSQSYRNPALLALMCGTLQSLSAGRLILGLGAGWKEDEYRAYNYDYPSPGKRIEQLEEAVEIVKMMWSEPGPLHYQGKHHQIANAIAEPRPEPVPRLVIGGGGAKTIGVAARHADWWNISDAGFERYRALMDVVDEACAAAERDPASLRRTWFGRLAVGETEEEAARLGGERWTRENAFVGTVEQVVESMKSFVDIGADYFMLEVQGLPDPAVVDRVIGEVLPAVRNA